MNFEDETYVRLYTRKTITRKRLGFEGWAVLCYLLCEADRAGIIEVGDGDLVEALTVLLGDAPEEVIRKAIPRLESYGVTQRHGSKLLIVRFQEAQEAKRSDAARAKEYRDRRRADLVTQRDGSTVESDEASRGVTARHDSSLSALPCSALPPLGETPARAKNKTKKPAPKPKTKRKRQRKTPIPTNFSLTGVHFEHARLKGYPEWWARNRFEVFVEAAGAKGFENANWDMALYASWRREMTEWGNTPEKLAHLAPRSAPVSVNAAGPVATEKARREQEFQERRRADVAAAAAKLAKGASGSPTPSEVRKLTGSLFNG